MMRFIYCSEGTCERPATVIWGGASLCNEHYHLAKGDASLGISVLGLDKRMEYALVRRRINTIEELKEWYYGDRSKLRNVGKKTIKCIGEALERYQGQE